MFPDILSKEQKDLLPLINSFKKEFYLVGGTAIALQIGHRKSVDFDLFKKTPFRTKKILNKLDAFQCPYLITRNVSEQLNLVISMVKMTFFEYPYPIEPSVNFDRVIRMPDLQTLSAMKAYALGRRSKWKDYVDLYFLIKDHIALSVVIKRAESIFGQEFSSKLFLSQLAYHADIDYSEEVDYMPAYSTEPAIIKDYLVDQALSYEEESSIFKNS